ncbi:MAG: DNA polymerase ligase N-terminal domain-containing protein [Chloroflexota bacterium]
MNTESYEEKRYFDCSPEMMDGKEAPRESRFVIHRHQATQLHSDLRLEIGGVLKCWVISGRVPDEPGLRRLAVEADDHPVEYVDFTGVIPEGDYGAGTVEIWDRGEFALAERTPNYLKFVLRGQKLSGGFILIRMDAHNWLFMRQWGKVKQKKKDLSHAKNEFA